MSPDRDDIAVAAGLLSVLVVVAVVFYGYYSTLPPKTPRYVIGNIQLLSTNVEVTSLSGTDVNVDMKAVIYNPNFFGATLKTANYSIYANGGYLGSGQVPHQYDVSARSSQTLVFPITVSWGSAFGTAGSYITSLGQVTWKVEGTATVVIAGISVTAPFVLTTG